MNNVTLLKLLDKAVGIPLSLALPPPKNRQRTISQAGHVLFIRPGGIGDAVLLSPAIKRLKAMLPETVIDVLCEKRNNEIFRNIREVSEIYRYDSLKELRRCLAGQYDVVVDTEQWHRLSAVTSYFTNSRFKIGFATNSRKRLFTHTVDYSQNSHETLDFIRLLDPLPGKNVSGDVNIPVPFMNTGDMKHVSLSNTVLPDKFIVIAPGTTLKEKMWPPEKFGEVARTLASSGINIVLTGSLSDKCVNSKIKNLEDSCLDLTGKTGLTELLYILDKSSLLLSPDSGIMHMASSMGIPVVAIFGPSNEKKWAPLSRHTIIKSPRRCRPCSAFSYTPRCTRNAACIRDISPDEVISAVKTLLA